MPLVVMDENITPKELWSRPVTINGNKFSLAIPCGASNTGNSTITIAKKLK